MGEQAIRHGEFRTQLNGLELWYRVSGRGPVCILPTPGWGVSIQYLEGLRPLEELFTVVYLETRGTGRSQTPATTAEFGWEHFTADLEALRQHLQQERVWLLGHSQGGVMVMHYVLTHPKRVLGLLVVDSIPGFDAEWMRESRARAEQYGQGVLWERIVDAILYHPPTTADELQALDNDSGPVAPCYWHDLANVEKHAATFAATTTALQPYQGVAHSHLADFDFVSRLPDIAAPALIVVGASDGVCSLSQSQRLHLGLAHSKLLVIEKTGHFPWLEEPNAFFAGMRAFLPVLGYRSQL
ncbi:MAG: alpha/beta hydrolase [Caldilineaceae bacterium]